LSRITSIVVLLGGVAACSEHSTPPGDPGATWGVPVTGGTLLVSHDQRHAVVADPDRDMLYAVDLYNGSKVAIPLQANDEPGRVIEDGAGRIHVALRRGGAIVTLADAVSGEIIGRRPVCADPRGLAWDSATDLIHVACMTGELVSIPAAGGDAVRNLRLDRDLRDVMVSGTQLIVTRFRTAEVITLDATGAIVSRANPPAVPRLGGIGEPPPDPTMPPPPIDPGLAGNASIAWRTISMPNGGGMLMTHQRQVQSTLSETEGGYGGMCGDGPIEDALTLRNADGTFRALARMAHGSLPVDIAITTAGDQVAVVSAGSQSITVLPTNTVVQSEDDGGCGGGFPGGGGEDGGGVVPDDVGLLGLPIQDHLGIPTSVAFANSDLVVFYPEMPAVVVHFADTMHVIQLPADFGYDAGRALFHQQTQVGIACASCHPEGHNDGLVWTFEEGVRRTQDLGGNLLQRAPFHWTGDMTDIPTLMENVFSVRMAGGEPSDSAKQMLGPFLDRIPAPAAPPPLDAAAVARGETIFESQATGCTTCHNGALLTNKTIINVGTGQPFKVPSLIGVGGRAPFLHDGCAATLADRFGTCGGGDLHGHTSTLTAGDQSDLVAFLNSL